MPQDSVAKQINKPTQTIKRIKMQQLNKQAQIIKRPKIQQQNKQMHIAFKDDPFGGAINLNSIEIMSNSFTFSNLFTHCSSLNYLFLQTDGDILLTPISFQSCHLLISVKIVSASKIIIRKKAFDDKRYLESVDFRCDSINIKSESFFNCSSFVSF